MIEDENAETMDVDDSATFRFVSEDEASRVKVPGYALRREVSRGGQGVVYEAVQESTGQRVALKVVHRTLTDAEHQKQRLDREVRILGTLLHPNIVSILDRGTTDEGLEYFAMRFIDGLPLDRWLATYRESRETVELAQNPGEVLILFRTICEAIQVAHEAGVVHRDLKPSNIRVDRNNLPHVLDFGIARDDASYQSSPESPLTLTGQFLGSLPWASPEQAEGKPELINARTDVYALGVILYQALTGEFPYEVVGNMRDVLDNIMRVEPTPPSKMIVAKQAKQAQDARVWRKQHPEVINPQLEDIVLKALAKRQEDRYENAGALAADIARYLAGQKPTAEPHVPAPTRRSKLPIIIILTVLVVVMSILLVVSRPEPEPEPEPEPAAGQSAVHKTSRELISGPDKGDAVAQQSEELQPGPDDFEASVLDVAQEQADDHITIPAIWQSFRAETTGVLTHISLRPNIYIQGGGTSSGELSVYQGTGTDGSQLFLRTWALESASNAPWQTFDVHVPVEVGQTYTWELTGVSNVYYADTDVYPQGVSSSPPRDLVFRTYVATTPKAQLATPKSQLATPKVQVQPDSGKGASTLPIGTVQAIDGKKAEGEWDAALQKEVSIVLPAKIEGKAMLYVMNDHDNLYVAFECPTEADFRASFAYSIYTKDGKSPAAGRDFGHQNSDIVLSSYYDGVGSVEDVDKGGTNDGSGRYGWEKGQSFFEFSKPLLTGDANDQAMHHGDSYSLGFSLRLIDPKLSRHGKYPVGFGDTEFPRASHKLIITIATPKAEGGASTAAQAADAARLARRHTIVLRQGGFSPVNFQVSSRWKPDNNQLTQNRFDNIIKEPGYSGLEQWYGHLDLGNRQDKQFHFVLDLQKDSRFLMYFDKNNNNDLTDDGVPMGNRGSGKGGFGGFACNIIIPWTTLIERSPFPGDFDIWFFNSSGKRISHYSRTQLRGNVLIDGTEYLAMLIDQGPNDADLSNDGIAIDINQNGKIDLDERPAQSHTINGVTHTFNIIW